MATGMDEKNIVLLLVVVVLVIGGWKWYGSGEEEITKDKIVVYKSPNCGCCVGHVGTLRKNGYEVEVVSVDNMASVKGKNGVPKDMESCHTSVVGDYFVEGHVPMEAIDKLLNDKPDIRGIALPGMPPGSPGMPGVKRSPFVIFGLGEKIEEFMVL